MEWEKLISNCISQRGLIYKICRELIQLNRKKERRKRNPQAIQSKKWAEELNRHFPKDLEYFPKQRETKEPLDEGERGE